MRALVLLLVAGCASFDPATDPATDPDTGGKGDGWGTATITFGDDWSERVDGTIREGATVAIRYDADRLPGCRGEMNGVPQWAITAYASVDGGAAQIVGLDAVGRGALELGDGEDLAMWFSVSNRWGCIAWDSNFGDDYHFDIAPADAGAATVSFDADGTVTLAGELVAGGTLTVYYDPARDETCRGTQGGYPQWSVTGYASVDGRAPRTFEPTEVAGADRVTRPVTLDVPAGDTLALWFQHTNRWGCVAWDSNDGADFVFPIH